MNWNELFPAMEKTLDIDCCLERIRTIIYSTDRWFSFKRGLDTAEYCAQAMRDAGLEQIKLLPLCADGKTTYGDWSIPRAWHADHAVLRFLDGEVLADYEKMPCSLVMYSPSTPSGGIEAEVDS